MAISATLARAFKTGTISSTAVAMADIGGAGSGFSTADLGIADRVRITCTGNAVRYRYDGSAPTASVGHNLAVDGQAIIEGNENINNLQFIRATGSDGAVSITLEAY
jgi:hypothetical protein